MRTKGGWSYNGATIQSGAKQVATDDAHQVQVELGQLPDGRSRWQATTCALELVGSW
jgi:hypothetical protein